MTSRQPDAATRSFSDLFRVRLDNLLNQRHALYRLADLIEWSVFDEALCTVRTTVIRGSRPGCWWGCST